MSRIVKACIVGGGMRALEHAEVIRNFPNIKLVGVFDPYPQPAKHWLTQVRVPFYNDLTYMLGHTRPDFALVTGPHDSHLDVVGELACRGVPIMKEKPLARNLAEARVMLDLAQTVKFFITVQRRFSHILGLVPGQLQHIGAAKKFSFQYTLNTSEPASGWRGSKVRAGGGCILDMGYHLIDLMLWYFGQPQSVTAQFQIEEGQEVENEARISVAYDSGLEGDIFISRRSSPKREVLAIVGEDGRIDVERGRITRTEGGGNVSFEHKDATDWGMILARQFRSFLGQLNSFTEPSGLQAGQHLSHVAFVEACYLSQSQRCSVNPCVLCL